MPFTVGEFLTKWGFEVETEKLDQTQKMLEGIKHRLDFIIGVEMVQKLGHFVEKFAEFGEQLHNTAASSGMTVEQIQKLSYAAKQAGVSADQVQTSMFKLGRMLYEAKNGSKQASEAFQKAGFSGEQLRGFKNGQDVLLALSQTMSSTPDIFKRQALASELLGRNSREMVGWLSKGPKAIKDAGKEAKDLGIILTETQVKGLSQLNSALGKLYALIQGVSASMASVLAPVFSTVLDKALEMYKAFRGLVEVRTEDWQAKLAYGLGFLLGLFARLTVEVLTHKDAILSWLKTAAYTIAVYLAVTKTLDFTRGAIDKISIAVNIAKNSWWAISQVLIFLKGPIVFLIELLGYLFNSVRLLGIAIAIAEAPAWAIGAAIAALVLGVQALWKVLSGGSFADTWLGQLLKGGMGAVNWAIGKLTGSEVGQSAIQAMSGAGGAGIPGISPGPLTKSAPELTSPRVGSSNYTVNAPTEINVPAGTTPEQVGPYVKDAIVEHLDRIHRQTQRSITGAITY